ncbi:hypothetical protein N0V90_004658 [Kalmusia sp. IMI 367209]|nr:hypothetical protein N0V90_004658 [Kalmusia sp. IMI 367209]
MAGHAEQYRRPQGHSHWHTSRSSYPQRKQTAFDAGSLDHRRAHSDPVPQFRPGGWLRHTHSAPVDVVATVATVVVDDNGTRPTVTAARRRTSEPPRWSSTAAGNTRDESGAAHAAIGTPWLVLHPSTAPEGSSLEPDSLADVQTPTLSPSAGHTQIALKPRLSHQLTSVPTQHPANSVPHKSVLRHSKSPSLPRLTLDIPPKQSERTGTVIDMATSRESPPPMKKTSLSSREKRVSFSTAAPEIIEAPSKRRTSSVNQRPSWSNVFLLRDPKVRDDPAARSRSLSPGPSILKEFSAFRSDASDAELKQDKHGVERKVHIAPLWEKNLKRLPRGRQAKVAPLPIPQAKVSRNANARTMSPEDASPTDVRDVSPRSLSSRYASPRDDTFEKSKSENHSIVVHPPSPPESDAEDDEDAVEDSDAEDSVEAESPTRHSRNSSLDEIDAIDNRFSKCDIDAHPHAVRHEKQRHDSQDARKGSQDSRRSSQASRKDSQGSRKDSQGSRKDSQGSRKDSDPKRPTPGRRSSSADAAEKWLRRSSIYGVRSRTPRVPTRLGSLRA